MRRLIVGKRTAGSSAMTSASADSLGLGGSLQGFSASTGNYAVPKWRWWPVEHCPDAVPERDQAVAAVVERPRKGEKPDLIYRKTPYKSRGREGDGVAAPTEKVNGRNNAGREGR